MRKKVREQSARRREGAARGWADNVTRAGQLACCREGGGGEAC